MNDKYTDSSDNTIEFVGDAPLITTGASTQVDSEEQAVAANIEKLARLLNEELEKAFRLQLKTQVISDNYKTLFTNPRPDHVTVRVWREVTLVTPKPSRGIRL